MQKLIALCALVLLLSSCFQSEPEVINETQNNLPINQEAGNDNEQETQEPIMEDENNDGAADTNQTDDQVPTLEETSLEEVSQSESIEPQEVITPEEEDQIVEDTIQDIEDIFKLLETE